MKIAIRAALSILLGILAVIILNLGFSYLTSHLNLSTLLINKPEIIRYFALIAADIIIISDVFIPISFILKYYIQNNLKYLEVLIVQLIIFISVIFNISPLLFEEFTYYSFYSILNSFILVFGLLIIFYFIVPNKKLTIRN
jgi:hypothetical protein